MMPCFQARRTSSQPSIAALDRLLALTFSDFNLALGVLYLRSTLVLLDPKLILSDSDLDILGEDHDLVTVTKYRCDLLQGYALGFWDENGNHNDTD